MRVYFDTSALLKRAVQEPESDALRSALVGHFDARDVLLSSTLTWIEVSRSLRTRLDSAPIQTITAASEDALSGLAEWPINPEVVSLARRIGPTRLRSLDAIHLATAVLVDAEVMVTYDDRLAEAARSSGIAVTAPA